MKKPNVPHFQCLAGFLTNLKENDFFFRQIKLNSKRLTYVTLSQQQVSYLSVLPQLSQASLD